MTPPPPLFFFGSSLRSREAQRWICTPLAKEWPRSIVLTPRIAWFVPPSWQGDHPEPENILDAAKFASEAAKLSPQRQVPFSNIPLVVHQKWNDVDLSRLNSHLLGYIERWLEYSVSANDTFREMAYFFWADDGVASLVDRYEPDFVQDFETMFSRVEKVDIFRVLVCKWFGGIVCSALCFAGDCVPWYARHVVLLTG